MHVIACIGQTGLVFQFSSNKSNDMKDFCGDLFCHLAQFLSIDDVAIVPLAVLSHQGGIRCH